MTQPFIKTKPSLMEAGLPCSSLSAECQRDNNARIRPPQNRLHIWWARRPPTICRVAMLSALLPHDVQFAEESLPSTVTEPSETDLDELPAKFQVHRAFFARLLAEVGPTPLSRSHGSLLRSLGIMGDPDRAYRRMAMREEYLVGNKPILLPMDWTYRHSPAFAVSPSESLIEELLRDMRDYLGLKSDEPITMLDFMAGGGAIPLEGVRHGMKVYANDLNPVASMVLKATLQYPAKFGLGLVPTLQKYAALVDAAVRTRLRPFFYTEPGAVWWAAEKDRVTREYAAKDIIGRGPADKDSSKNCYLWCRTIGCPKCGLNIPLSSNFNLVTQKGKPEASVAAFPEVPPAGQGNDCTFRIVGAAQWADCLWPGLGTTPWHPRNTPTFQEGHGFCPRCGNHVDESNVKKAAQSRAGGLPSQIYTVCSQVPVKLGYRDGTTKIRFLWRFRAPTDADLAAVEAAEAELDRNRDKWASLIPTEPITPDSNYNRGHRLYGLNYWRDLFTPRQLLANVTVLEEVRKATQLAKSELPPHQAEAVAVYLSFVLDKVVSYNSALCSWDDGRKKIRNAFPGHDYRYHATFAEIESSRETVMWGASQVIGAYSQVAGLIHGEPVSLEGDDDPEAGGGEDSSVKDGEAGGGREIPVDDVDDEGAESCSLQQAAPAPPRPEDVHLRPEVVVPTITCNDAAALETPAPGTVHLICVDPPYYNNVLYAELSNYFYVWLKRALGDWPGLEPFFVNELAESSREAVANIARWKAEAEQEQGEWQARFATAFATLEGAKGNNGRKLTKPVRTERAKEEAGPEPLTPSERAERFYEAKMAAVFRRAKQLLHPAGRMVVMFNHKMTKAWRAIGRSLIEAGFEIRTSIPILTEAAQGLNIRGLDAARSTVLLLCVPSQQTGQVTGNWGRVQDRIALVARNAAAMFQKQGIFGTDLYLSALGPTLGEVGRHWPITDMAGREIDLAVALEKAYRAVGQFRLEQILAELAAKTSGAVENFAPDTADRNTQALWLWLDTFQGDVADSDDVRKLAKSMDTEPDTFKKLKLIETESDTFTLKAPQEVDLALLARQLSGEKLARGRAAREEDAWEERKFRDFLGAAAWNAISLMAGGDETHRGVEALKRWLGASGYGGSREFRGAFAVTLHLLEQAFGKRREEDAWKKATTEARRAWDLVIRDWRV